MFIETIETPNPNALKFQAQRVIYEAGSLSFTLNEYKQNKDSVKMELIKNLFDVDGIIGIFIANNFITITKKEDEEWAVLKPIILAELMEFLLSDENFQNVKIEKKEKKNSIKFSEEETSPEKNPIIKQILEIIEERVRPAVAMDGGDVIFRGYKENIVYLELSGACDGCPSSSVTLNNGINNILKYYIPEIKEVSKID